MDVRIGPGPRPLAVWLPVLPDLRLGTWLNRACAIHGWSHLELSRRSGVSVGTIYAIAYEHRRSWSLVHMAALADAFGVDRAVPAVLALREFERGHGGW
ncbi:helix-turn-helix transcriptional regulator [Amycolatopsis sp. CA-128772]|uniref:helix-turn-helix domain-containing protein n=1 Tax=Amycolatopsis sp. CA-128772 TaxID=2073159 RepID=UPI001304C770|nr:helix-turn-helix transcriptional regulator [Amycolatopsis sp. CA-128772]